MARIASVGTGGIQKEDRPEKAQMESGRLPSVNLLLCAAVIPTGTVPARVHTDGNGAEHDVRAQGLELRRAVARV